MKNNIERQTLTMQRTYTVYLIHKMRSVQTVEANNKEEAKEKAYKKSFEEEGWEEIDTDYCRIEEGEEIEDEEELEIK